MAHINVIAHITWIKNMLSDRTQNIIKWGIVIEWLHFQWGPTGLGSWVLQEPVKNKIMPDEVCR